jgi:beta-fructofuranosidase
MHRMSYVEGNKPHTQPRRNDVYSRKENNLGQPGDHEERPEQRLSLDPHRPAYHFMPSANWMNDPNGLIHWKGKYHMFYQYNPRGPFHDKIHWGHAVSTDLVHWEHLPDALAPTQGSPDEDGCFSGCAVNNNGVPTLIYTGVRGEQQLPCIATSEDDLLTWHKYAGNPVIAAPPSYLDLVGYRDHSVWKEGHTWYQIIGSGIKGRGGTALLYRSMDLLQWEYVHPLLVGDVSQVAPLWSGSMWECPDFFSMGEHHLLVVSVWYAQHPYYPIYFTGTYSDSDHRFTPEQLHKLDFGASFYAPQTLRDERGRRIMWGWLREERDDGAVLAAGWSGVMSLPRVLSLRADGMLEMRPAPEIETLRGRHCSLREMVLAEGSLIPLVDMGGDTLEIVAEFEPGDATEVGIVVRCSQDQREQTRILYDSKDQHLVMDASQSSLNDTARLGRHAGPLVLSSGETLRLRIFLDRSVVEVFGNEQACVTGRIYPSRNDSLAVSVFAHGGTARLKSLDIWEMGSIWTEREPNGRWDASM